MEALRPKHASLVPLETTTANSIDQTSAIALLNFAALFHETVFLSDTTLGDHRLIIESTSSTDPGSLYNTIRDLIDEGVVYALYRDKVAIRDSTLVAQEPTLREIYEGWRERDRKEWKGESGITTAHINPQIRFKYYEQIQRLLTAKQAIVRYNPDVNKQSFRSDVKKHLGKDDGILSARVGLLPNEVQRQYKTVVNDDWFTNAELWRLLKPLLDDERTFDIADSLISLHGHLNQQVLADMVTAGQSVQSDGTTPIAAFHRELHDDSGRSQEVEAHLEPPVNLDALLEHALVRIEAPAICLIGQLSVEEIIELRKYGRKVFRLANQSLVNADPEDLEILKRDYINALRNYWERIVDTIEKKSPKKMVRYPLTIWLEQHAPIVQELYSRYGKPVETMLLRLAFSKAGPLVGGVVVEGIHHLGVALFQEKTDLNLDLRASIPPKEWHTRSILGLEPVRRNHL